MYCYKCSWLTVAEQSILDETPVFALCFLQATCVVFVVVYVCVCLLLAVHVLLVCVREESSDESEDEMEVEGAAPTPSTSRGAKHDIIIKQEVRNVFSRITVS